jgi:hypothetical protein
MKLLSGGKKYEVMIIENVPIFNHKVDKVRTSLYNRIKRKGQVFKCL